MTTREQLHRIVDAVPDDQLPTFNAALAQAYILSSPAWMADIEESRQQKEAGIPGTPWREAKNAWHERHA